MSNKLTIHLTVSAAQGAPRVAVEIAKDVTGAALRQQAVQATKIPAATLKLIFRGRLIANDDKKAVEEYKLEEGSVLHCMGQPETSATAAEPSSALEAAAPPRVAPLPSVNNLIPPTTTTAAAVPSSTSVSAGGEPLTLALRTLRASNPPQVYRMAVETLEKLLQKIIDNPMEAKYRKVKKENPAFVRKLGGLPGGEAAMKAAGFVVETDEAQVVVYHMHASAEAWPKLLQTQTTLRAAVQEAAALTTAPVAPPMGMPGFPSMATGVGGMLPNEMSRATASLMSNPQALQAMLQNPMVQNMLRNDPRFANNPMAQQMMQNLASNPAMLQQVAQMMQDPTVQQQIQQMQQNPAMMQQMRQMQGMMWENSGGANTGGTNTVTNNNNSGSSDQDMTEEEMIAEAIRRSLQDNNNNDNN